MGSVLNKPHYHDEAEAYRFVEAHLWPNGPVCPRCGESERIGKLKGKSTRLGVHKCYKCRKPFTVKIGTIFEASHVPMNLWLQAIFLMCSSKKGVSSNQLHRTLGVHIRTAWFMSHRIREAMRLGSLVAPMGQKGGAVEIDETYIGRKKSAVIKQGGSQHKNAVLTLVSRDGEARSFHIDRATKRNVTSVVRANVSKEAVALTDEHAAYDDLPVDVAHHARVNHARGEYVSEARSEWLMGDITTNTVEGYFSIFKRGMKGVYQHCSEQHLHRYLAEFDFRFSHRVRLGVNDEERTARALLGVKGKRLTYRPADKEMTR